MCCYGDIFHVLEVRRDLRPRDRREYKLPTREFCAERPLHDNARWRKKRRTLNRERVQRHKRSHWRDRMCLYIYIYI